MILASAYARQQRDQLLNVAVNALNRHRNQIEFGITPTLSHEQLLEVGAYAQALRDVPQQEGFPYNHAWPQTPSCLAKYVVG